METHLAAIHASLDQLHALHARMNEASKQKECFTQAVLHPGQVDILELIRDADAFEASLFVSQGERSGDIKAPKPALRPVTVPTPLKQPRTETSDARTYLLAAEKLLQNYHNAPRARQHIRMLLKREAELQRHRARYQSMIDQASKAQAQQASSSGALPSPARTPTVDATELKRVQDEIQRERMEILALESLLGEHDRDIQPSPSPARTTSPVPTAPIEARQASTPRRTTPRTNAPARTEMARTPQHRPPISGSQTPRDARSPMLQRSARASPAASLSQSVSSPRRTTPARPFSQSVSGTPTQSGTPRRGPARASPAGKLVPVGTVPPSTDALERMAAQAWERFGEPLRYAHPGCVSASFSETFQALRQLEQGVPRDESALPSYGSAPNPTGPLSVSLVMMAHVMLLLMRTPAPHTLSLPSIKALSDTWWRQQGQAALQAAVREPASCSALVQQVGFDPTDMEQTGDALATRAVYGLVAKKVLRIQRAGGAPSVSFA